MRKCINCNRPLTATDRTCPFCATPTLFEEKRPVSLAFCFVLILVFVAFGIGFAEFYNQGQPPSSRPASVSASSPPHWLTGAEKYPITSATSPEDARILKNFQYDWDNCIPDDAMGDLPPGCQLVRQRDLPPPR